MRLRLGSPREKKIRAPSPEEGTQDKLSKRMPMATRRLAGSLYPSAHLSMDSFSAPEDPHLNLRPALPLLSFLWGETATQCHHCPTSWTQAQMEVAFCKLPLATVCS